MRESFQPSRPFELGPWRVEPASNRLAGEVGIVRLEPKVMDLLVALAEHPGEVVSRERLLDTVWPDVHVSDEALTTAVYQLRRALGDDARAPRFVETVPKRGYRLVATPERVEPVEPVGPVGLHRRRLQGLRPALAAAVALVALCLGLTGGAPEGAERADELYRRAVERALGDWEFARAEADARRALALDPDHAPSHELMAQLHFIAGREREALDSLERARRAAPESPSPHRLSGTLTAALGHPERAGAHFRRALELDPADRGAARGLAKLAERRRAGVADTTAAVDRIASALDHGPVRPSHVAGLYAEIGAADRAFDWLDRAWRERDPGLFFLRYDTRWEPYRDDPRLRDVLARFGPAAPSRDASLTGS